MTELDKSVPQEKKKSLHLIWGMLSLAALLLAIGSWIKVMQIQNQQMEREEIASQARHAFKNELRAEYQLLSNDIVKNQRLWQQAHAELQAKFQSASQQPIESQNWQLLQVRYYLQLAQIGAYWSSDKNTTLGLLEEADQVLKNSAHPSVLALRQELAKDIAQVQALPSIDKVGLLSQLDAIHGLISQIPVSKLKSLAPLKPKSSSTWMEQWQNSVNTMRKLVIIQHTNEPGSAFAGKHIYLRESLQLYLITAQWAVLQNDNTQYQYALGATLDLLKKEFDPTSAKTQQVIAQLQELQKQSLSVPKIKLTQSLILLNQLLQEGSKKQTPQKGGIPL